MSDYILDVHSKIVNAPKACWCLLACQDHSRNAPKLRLLRKARPGISLIRYRYSGGAASTSERRRDGVDRKTNTQVHKTRKNAQCIYYRCLSWCGAWAQQPCPVRWQSNACSIVVARDFHQFALPSLCSTPPMGWMSWEIFRCNLNTPTDNCTDPTTTNCISQALYQGQADAMVAGGFSAAGYSSIHMDDCWEEKNPPRDPTTGELRADFIRFPDGMKALGDYVHNKGLTFAIYSAESSTTCGGYPASANHEVLDASTFASWGVGKFQGNGPVTSYR